MKATTAQLRKIHVLAGERGIDNDTLHTHVFNITESKSKPGGKWITWWRDSMTNSKGGGFQ